GRPSKLHPTSAGKPSSGSLMANYVADLELGQHNPSILTLSHAKALGVKLRSFFDERTPGPFSRVDRLGPTAPVTDDVKQVQYRRSLIMLPLATASLASEMQKSFNPMR